LQQLLLTLTSSEGPLTEMLLAGYRQAGLLLLLLLCR
jgi:hypothetical protein